MEKQGIRYTSRTKYPLDGMPIQISPGVNFLGGEDKKKE